jgi:peptide chain release factor 3
MFFGSALTNFGVLPFLERFLKIAPAPYARPSNRGLVDPVDSPFSGFVFKIQANMDPDHRDRAAFLRICSGCFRQGANTFHVPSGKKIRLANSTLLMAQDRQEVKEAYPGDVVGLFDPGIFRIGDTLGDVEGLVFEGIPSFSPEHFARVKVAEVLKRKALNKGLDQLTQEGLVQLFSDPGSGSAAPILGAVGPLQFDVLKFRMMSEYNVELKLTPMPFTRARWPRGKYDPEAFRFSQTAKIVEDREGQPVLLFDSPWSIQSVQQRNPGLELLETAGQTSEPGADGA